MQIAFSPDGNRLAAGDGRNSLYIWDTTSKKMLLTLATRDSDESRSHLRDVAFRPDGHVIATTGDDGSVKLWNVSTGRRLNTFRIGPRQGVVNHIEFSPDGKLLATVNGNGTAYILRVDGK